MKPVMQKHQYPHPTPDCQSACIASILEIPLEEVPNLYHMKWENTMNDFLNRRFNKVGLVGVGNYCPIEEYYIATINFGKGYYHAVVAKDDKIVHDPSGLIKTPIALNDIIKSSPGLERGYSLYLFDNFKKVY